MSQFALLWAILFFLASDAWAGGSLSGVVRYQGEPLPPKRHPVTVDAAVCGPEGVSEELVLGKRGGVRDAVVFLEGRVEGAQELRRPPGGFTLDQKNCQFEPHVLVVAPGSDVFVLNSDILNHHLKTLSRTNPPLSVAQPKSAPRLVLRFDHPEIIEIRCGVHEWQKGWIVVAQNPYYVVTDLDGRFEIKDIPAGDYTVTFWQETLGYETRRVQVREGEVLKLDVTLRRHSENVFPPNPHFARSISRLDINVLPIRLVE